MNDLSKWHELFSAKNTPVNKLKSFKGVNISVKRDDLNHKIIQGNKLRKLKYNLKHAIDNKYTALVTFGGAFSNHIVATAQAAKLCNIECIGFIRGDELQKQVNKWSETLKQAQKIGMQFVFLNREEYRKKQTSLLVKKHLEQKNSKVYVIPEGGSNQLALKGVAEIIEELKLQVGEPTHIITACGTGGTLAGLIDGVALQGWETEIIGIPVLKGAQFLLKDIKNLSHNQAKVNWQLFFDYHAGGYAKINQVTIDFGVQFVKDTSINLDKVYTSKSFYAAYDLIENGYIKPGSHLVILHTGGLQGGLITDC